MSNTNNLEELNQDLNDLKDIYVETLNLLSQQKNQLSSIEIKTEDSCQKVDVKNLEVAEKYKNKNIKAYMVLTGVSITSLAILAICLI